MSLPDGKLLAGDKDLPAIAPPSGDEVVPGEIYMRDADFKGQDLRLAYTYLSETTMPKAQWVIIEVGETTEKRSQLANKIVASVILPQFIIIPLAVMLVWFGLSRGLRPLTRCARPSTPANPTTCHRLPPVEYRKNWSRWSRPSTKCWPACSATSKHSNVLSPMPPTRCGRR
jgi:two-component system sensor histidine kinase TctE